MCNFVSVVNLRCNYSYWGLTQTRRVKTMMRFNYTIHMCILIQYIIMEIL